MADKSLADLAEKMRDIDICILSTRTEGGAIAGRPMSNNRQVDYDGDSYYFALGDTRTVGDIERDRHVGLGFQGEDYFYVAVEGEAELIRAKDKFAAHWSSELDRWFEDGIDTAGLVLIRVDARRIHYWDGWEEGELTP